MNSEKAYLLLQKESGISVGDTVRILRKAKSYEMGWSTSWMPRMDRSVGETGEVISIEDEDGFLVLLEDDQWYYPFFVLEIVEEYNPIYCGEEEVYFAENGSFVEIKNEFIDFDIVEKIYKRMKELRRRKLKN